MNPLDQLRDEIANLHLLADRLASAKPHTPTLEECEQAFHEAYGNALRPGINLAGLAAVRDLCLASRFPSHELVEAAAAHAGKSTQATVLRTQHAAAEAESANVHEQLATVRAAVQGAGCGSELQKR